LRKQFLGEGTAFKVVLSDCDQLVYQEYDSSPVKDFDEIVGLEPEILGFEKGTYPVVVNCVMGSLKYPTGPRRFISIRVMQCHSMSLPQLVKRIGMRGQLTFLRADNGQEPPLPLMKK